MTTSGSIGRAGGACGDIDGIVNRRAVPLGSGDASRSSRRVPGPLQLQHAYESHTTGELLGVGADVTPEVGLALLRLGAACPTAPAFL